VAVVYLEEHKDAQIKRWIARLRERSR
jgi:hypothetical protein